MGGFASGLPNRIAPSLRRGRNRALGQAQLAPSGTASPFANVQIGQDGQIMMGDSGMSGMFLGQAGEHMQQAGGGPMLAGSAMQFGPAGEQVFNDMSSFDPRMFQAGFQPMANQFMGMGQQAGQALQGFDADAFAQTQMDRMNQLAQPGEQMQANQTAQRLFSGGRLGAQDTTSGQVFRDLSQAQQMAQTERAMQSVGMAGQERDRLAQQAGMFSQLGMGAQSAEQDALFRATGQANEQQMQQAQMANLFGSQGIQQMAPMFQQLQAALSMSGMGTDVNLARAGIHQNYGTQSANMQGAMFGGFMQNAHEAGMEFIPNFGMPSGDGGDMPTGGG